MASFSGQSSLSDDFTVLPTTATVVATVPLGARVPPTASSTAHCELKRGRNSNLKSVFGPRQVAFDELASVSGQSSLSDDFMVLPTTATVTTTVVPLRARVPTTTTTSTAATQ